jgi:hypothetical protein
MKITSCNRGKLPEETRLISRRRSSVLRLRSRYVRIKSIQRRRSASDKFLRLQAWAARFTDHVSVIGSNGPTLAELRNGVGQDFTRVGKLREGFAQGVLQRAIETVDRRAGLRTASTACCSALVLLEFLVTCESRGFLFDLIKLLTHPCRRQGTTWHANRTLAATSSRALASICATCSSENATIRPSRPCRPSAPRTAPCSGWSIHGMHSEQCWAGVLAHCESFAEEKKTRSLRTLIKPVVQIRRRSQQPLRPLQQSYYGGCHIIRLVERPENAFRPRGRLNIPLLRHQRPQHRRTSDWS